MHSPDAWCSRTIALGYLAFVGLGVVAAVSRPYVRGHVGGDVPYSFDVVFVCGAAASLLIVTPWLLGYLPGAGSVAAPRQTAASIAATLAICLAAPVLFAREDVRGLATRIVAAPALTILGLSAVSFSEEYFFRRLLPDAFVRHGARARSVWLYSQLLYGVAHVPAILVIAGHSAPLLLVAGVVSLKCMFGLAMLTFPQARGVTLHRTIVHATADVTAAFVPAGAVVGGARAIAIALAASSVYFLSRTMSRRSIDRGVPATDWAAWSRRRAPFHALRVPARADACTHEAT